MGRALRPVVDLEVGPPTGSAAAVSDGGSSGGWPGGSARTTPWHNDILSLVPSTLMREWAKKCSSSSWQYRDYCRSPPS